MVTDHGAKALGDLQVDFFYHWVFSVLQRYPDLDVSGLSPLGMGAEDPEPEAEGSEGSESKAKDRCLETMELLKALSAASEQSMAKARAEEASRAEAGGQAAEEEGEGGQAEEGKVEGDHGDAPPVAPPLPASFIEALNDPVVAAFLAAGRAATLEEAEAVPLSFPPQASSSMVAFKAPRTPALVTPPLETSMDVKEMFEVKEVEVEEEERKEKKMKREEKKKSEKKEREKEKKEKERGKGKEKEKEKEKGKGRRMRRRRRRGKRRRRRQRELSLKSLL